MPPEQTGLNQILQFVNLISLPILILITAGYAVCTYYTLKATRTLSEATKSTAESSKQSIQIMKQQTEKAAAISRTIVASAINTAKTNIEQWKRIDIHTYALHSRIPENVTLVPLNTQSAIEHSGLISAEGTFDLISAFENLRRASWELNFLSKCHQFAVAAVKDHTTHAKNYMETASAELEAALTHFTEAISSFTEKRDPEGSRSQITK